MGDIHDMQVDPEQVIARLEAQLGAALGQITRLEVVIAGLVKQHAEAGNAAGPS